MIEIVSLLCTVKVLRRKANRYLAIKSRHTDFGETQLSEPSRLSAFVAKKVLATKTPGHDVAGEQDDGDYFRITIFSITSISMSVRKKHSTASDG